MKNKLTALVLLWLPLLCVAQIEFGIKGGANFANLDAKDVNTNSITSYYIGAFAEISIFENFSLQPEIQYSSQGAKVTGANDFKLNYVNVPVLAKFYLTTKGLSLEVGPQFGLLTNENVENQFSAQTFDFSAVGGLGYNITKNISAHARYVFGLTDVSKDAEITNRVIQIGVGYKF